VVGLGSPDGAVLYVPQLVLEREEQLVWLDAVCFLLAFPVSTVTVFALGRPLYFMLVPP
jgi:hypothetical protein